MSDHANDTEVRKLKDAIVREIFAGYKEAGIAYQKTANPEIKDALMAIRHGFDMALQRLLPLNEEAEKNWNKAGEQFSN